ncbi:hypothetical protein [Cupriavidus pauculus]|uniref:hypothetical protein n=1 Tax=Cupriavidus pauculus TaxID=82633 RepID=UPI001FCFE30A|nr:hypothetical protein [Cupriavidus pauculus]
MTATDIASTAMADRQYAHALDLVQTFRAASVALVQRHLGVDPTDAEALLARMARETDIVRRMPNGLYLFVGEAISDELRALRGFAEEVLAALTSDHVSATRIREAAARHGIAPTVATRRHSAP